MASIEEVSLRISKGDLIGSVEDVVIMGPPGGGKTSCAKLLSRALGFDLIDVDDDVLEVGWGCAVSSKLAGIGDDAFLVEESKTLVEFARNHSSNRRAVWSLTGSNPLLPDTMNQFRKSFEDKQKKLLVVYMDVNFDDICNRLESMKVDRIVGQSGGKSIREILEYRRSIYEKHYDLRVLVPREAGIEDVALAILKRIEEYLGNRVRQQSRFCSTRGYGVNTGISLEEAILSGLAPDGGLFVPKTIPSFQLYELERLCEVKDDYVELSLRILERWLFEIQPTKLRQMIQQAYRSDLWMHKSIAHLVKLEEKKYILELFNGPTASFKDFALQLFPQLFEHAFSALHKETKYVILVSTSGDTGSATVHGFINQTNIPVIVLYPSEGVSPVQEAQMKILEGERAKIIGVNSDFDFCQTTIKKLFNDEQWTNHLKETFNVSLSAANSINFGRLVPQIAYHFKAYFEVASKIGEVINCCIPTGNFGNILSAFFAKRSGLPLGKLICASNENNIISDFLETGCYDISDRKLSKTTSPSIDILVSSNIERMLYLMLQSLHKSDAHDIVKHLFNDLEKSKKFTIDKDLLQAIHNDFGWGWCNEVQSTTMILEFYQKYNYLIDPHTAVAVHVANSVQLNEILVIYSTAHYAKFPTAVFSALNKRANENTIDCLNELKQSNYIPNFHTNINTCLSNLKAHLSQNHVCDANITAVKDAVNEFLST